MAVAATRDEGLRVGQRLGRSLGRVELVAPDGPRVSSRWAAAGAKPLKGGACRAQRTPYRATVVVEVPRYSCARCKIAFSHVCCPLRVFLCDLVWRFHQAGMDRPHVSLDRMC